MITDRAAYSAMCEAEYWSTLRGMSPRESIALNEALLTSEIMAQCHFPDDDKPVSLAIARGIVTR